MTERSLAAAQLALKATGATVVEAVVSNSGWLVSTDPARPVLSTTATVEASFVGPAPDLGYVQDWVETVAVVPLTGPSAESGWIAAGWDRAAPRAGDGLVALGKAAMLIEDQLDRDLEASKLGELNALLRSNQAELRSARDVLASANRDLENFAYVAAHELAAPLRSVAVFADLLAHRSETNDGETAALIDQCVAEVQTGVQLMTDQVRYLLELSRGDPHSQRTVLVNLNDAATAAIDSLVDEIKGVGAVLEVQTLPVVRGRPVAIQAVFANLISNALRYRDTDRQLHISITVAAEKDGWRVSVADNGSGLDPSHAERVLGMFERGPQEHLGSGIGLAVTKRVVEGLGGRMALEPGDPSGAVGWFWLPSTTASPGVRSDE